MLTNGVLRQGLLETRRVRLKFVWFVCYKTYIVISDITNIHDIRNRRVSRNPGKEDEKEIAQLAAPALDRFVFLLFVCFTRLWYSIIIL